MVTRNSHSKINQISVIFLIFHEILISILSLLIHYLNSISCTLCYLLCDIYPKMYMLSKLILLLSSISGNYEPKIILQILFQANHSRILMSFSFLNCLLNLFFFIQIQINIFSKFLKIINMLLT